MYKDINKDNQYFGVYQYLYYREEGPLTDRNIGYLYLYLYTFLVSCLLCGVGSSSLSFDSIIQRFPLPSIILTIIFNIINDL